MSDCISYPNIPYYSKLILDYLSRKKELEELYHRFPTLENFKLQAAEKGKNFSQHHRSILVESLTNQYQNIEASPATQENIKSLKDPHTFTVTTGHQLNLFTGPLYFLYKIISVIKLTDQLKTTYPEYNFVPIYWLASEDHDFEEINYFNFKQEKVHWKSAQTGAVGRFSTTGMENVYDQFDDLLNKSKNADRLRELFQQSYLNHKQLTEATQYIANALFKEYGLVIIDGDDRELKKLFIPHIKNELLEERAYHKVTTTKEKLRKQGHIIQVNPRAINLFYLTENYRKRIVKEGNRYFIHETKKEFSETEILEAVEKNPERFSPNAIMRPLYQEVILPNLCYVGGSGELAYWLELKSYFEGENINFPILLLRNAALLITEKQNKKIEKLGLTPKDLFKNQEDLLAQQTRSISSIDINFNPQQEHLKKQFKDLYKLAEKTDKSFIGAIAAQEQKQINGLEHLEKRLLRAQKRKLKDELNRLIVLRDELFPSGNLQERIANFSEFYEKYGSDLIPLLYERLDPLRLKFNIITVDKVRPMNLD